MNGMSLLDVLRGVMLDPAEQAVYEADPHAYLEQYGYEDVEDADLSEAFGLVADTLPADQAQAAFTGEVGPDIPTLGGDTTDFDEPPPEVSDVDDASPAVDDDDLDDDIDDADDGAADDGFDDAFGDGGDDVSDTPDDDTDDIDLDLDDAPLSFGRGEDDGADAERAVPTPTALTTATPGCSASRRPMPTTSTAAPTTTAPTTPRRRRRPVRRRRRTRPHERARRRSRRRHGVRRRQRHRRRRRPARDRRARPRRRRPRRHRHRLVLSHGGPASRPGRPPVSPAGPSAHR